MKALLGLTLILSSCSLLQRPNGPGLSPQEIRNRQCYSVWSSGEEFDRVINLDGSKRIHGASGYEAEMYRRCKEKR